MLKNKKNRLLTGFTLIELLVVIAIIGILAGIVLVNVNTARNKAKDAGIKGSMLSLSTMGEMFYDDPAGGNFSYTLVCTHAKSDFPKVTTAVNKLSTMLCSDTATEWAACAQLKADITKYWCVDSTGVKKEVTGTCAAANVC